MSEDKHVYDALNHQPYHLTEGVFLSEVDGQLKNLIKHDHPQLKDDDFISNKNLLHYRLIFLNNTIERAQVTNDYIRETVYDVTKNGDYQTMDVQEALDSKVTFGQRIADDVARFGGSWTFIISFTLFMAIWMAVNVYKPFGIQFDAYPFILLNLALSTLAAIQAPLIMMSQIGPVIMTACRPRMTLMSTRNPKRESVFSIPNWITWFNKTNQTSCRCKSFRQKCWLLLPNSWMIYKRLITSSRRSWQPKRDKKISQLVRKIGSLLIAASRGIS